MTREVGLDDAALAAGCRGSSVHAGPAADNPGLGAVVRRSTNRPARQRTLDQEVGLGLGAQAGEARLRAVAEEAGFTGFRRATETPFNLVLEARP